MSKLDNDLLVIGGLSSPAKMPCASFSTPAARCHTGSKLRKIPGTTCSDCYACKGCYAFRSTVDAMQRRIDRLDYALTAFSRGEYIPLERWVHAFADVLNRKLETSRKKDARFFRWHDSGDLQSVTHLRAIAAVAQLTPNIEHWLPTREYGIVQHCIEGGDVFPPNLIIRLSAHYVDKPAKVPPSLAHLPTSEVHTGDASTTGAHECIAPQQDGACLDCRACWNRDVKTISYHKH